MPGTGFEPAQNLSSGLVEWSGAVQFARIHTSSLIKIEKIFNRPITKFYNSDGVNAIAAELRLTKTRPIRDNLLQETMPTYVNKVLKTKC